MTTKITSFQLPKDDLNYTKENNVHLDRMYWFKVLYIVI